MKRREYYGLDQMKMDLHFMHGVILEEDETWDEEVPQSVIDADIAQYEKDQEERRRADAEYRLKYEEECKDANLPYCRHCHTYYDPFSQHHCEERSWNSGGI